jgi:hypothetical protein
MVSPVLVINPSISMASPLARILVVPSFMVTFPLTVTTVPSSDGFLQALLQNYNAIVKLFTM